MSSFEKFIFEVPFQCKDKFQKLFVEAQSCDVEAQSCDKPPLMVAATKCKVEDRENNFSD